MIQQHRICALVGLLILSAIALVFAVFPNPSLPWRRQRTTSTAINPEDGFICHVERTLMSLDGGGHDELFECDLLSSEHNEMIPDMSISIDLSSDFIYENREALDAGDLYVYIPGGVVNEEYIEGFGGTVGTSVQIPPGADITVLDAAEVRYHQRRQRRHRRTSEEKHTRSLGTGTRNVMVVRVTTDDASPDIGAHEINERMFSTTSFSFASQFEKCSFGQLTFEPYYSETPVTELYVPGKVSSFTERTILNAATRRMSELFGKDIFDRLDHAIFCMPDGTSGKPYIAYSGVGSFFSVYHNLRCSYPTTVMHELAHNLGLGHAYEGGEEYGDETTIMGFSSSSKTGPSKCFNGQNIWHFGWFKSRSTMVDPFQGHQLVELAPFVDFDKTSLYQVVLITIFDMHIVYNRAKGFNSETSEYQNTVTIVKEEDEINSALLAVMDMNNPIFTIENLLGTGRTLYVELCDSSVGVWETDYYTISIGLDYSLCPQETPNPTNRPSPLHSPRPSPYPTPSPTQAPSTVAPTSQPTTEVTEFPSISPTSELPDIILVPFKPPTETLDDDLVVHPEEDSTTLVVERDVYKDPIPTNAPTVVPPLVVTATSTTLAPTDFGSNGESTETVSVAQSILDSLVEAPETTLGAILMAIILTLFVSCCAFSCYLCNQRRHDQQKRNVRALLTNASSQVKVYNQNPV